MLHFFCAFLLTLYLHRQKQCVKQRQSADTSAKCLKELKDGAKITVYYKTKGKDGKTWYYAASGKTDIFTSGGSGTNTDNLRYVMDVDGLYFWRTEDGTRFSKTGFMIRFDEAAERIGCVIGWPPSWWVSTR